MFLTKIDWQSQKLTKDAMGKTKFWCHEIEIERNVIPYRLIRSKRVTGDFYIILILGH